MDNRSRGKYPSRVLKHIVSYSGGKDSTALYLLALERRERTGRPFQAVFADTGNEHEATLEFVRTIHERTGGPKVRIVQEDLSGKFKKRREYVRTKWLEEGVPQERIDTVVEHLHPSGNPFLDLCMLRSGFPAPGPHRFCTSRLKVRPIEHQAFRPHWEQGDTVVSWQGIRRQEIPFRASMSPRQRIRSTEGLARLSEGRYVIFRPILDWKVEDVWAIHRRHGLEPNSLYRVGFERVGCMPCIFSSKLDIRAMATRFPHHVDRIAKWEKVVDLVAKKQNVATFMPALKKRDEALDASTQGIRARVEWSQTLHGGRKMMLFPIIDERSRLMQDAGTACGEWGVCE